MQSFPKSWRQLQVPKIAVLLLLLLLLGIAATPSYLTGHWRWAHPPKSLAFKQLRHLPKTELTIPGWQTTQRQVVPIGGHKWLVQEIQAQSVANPNSLSSQAPAKAALFLTAPSGDTSQPEVEWMDINGFQRWNTDSLRLSKFTVSSAELAATATGQKLTSEPLPVRVKARFLRGWTQQQTFAVLQWYAWPTGGSPAPSDWFWADRKSQLQNARQPWVAVCLLIPIEPLGDIESVWPVAQSLAQTVQAALITGPLTVPLK